MQGAQLIVLATPVFLLLIGLELGVGVVRGHNTYRVNDALSSIGLGILSQLAAVFDRALALGIYAVVFDHAAVGRLPAGSPWVWLSALLLYDFCYYWEHRCSHRVALLWASHVVHHQSEDYNLSTALRQPATRWLLGWIFYLPMAIAGVPPLVFGAVALADLLYQYWVHTQQIGRLGAFDRWFCTPSNHRVHHGVNDRYLDRNFGGILIVWDRLFGTYADQDDAEPCVYGTRTPLRSWNPLAANLQVYAALARDAWHARDALDKLRVWIEPPGWRPADVALADPKPPFDLARLRRYDPPLPAAAQGLAVALFVVLLTATLVFLWHAHALPWAERLGIAGMLVAGLWLVGAICTPRRTSLAAKEARV